MSFDTIVVSLPGTWDPGLPVAASRAGAVGVLDLTYLSDKKQLRHVTEQLQQNGRGETGYLVHARLGACEALLAELIQLDNLVILLPDGDQNLKGVVEFWRQQGNRIGLVATSLEEAEMGVTVGVDFIIGKGSETGGKIGREGSFVLMQRLLLQIELPVYVWGGISWNTALACKFAGAAGVVLDWQLSLLRESPLTDDLSRDLQKLDGSETSTLALSDQVDWRFLTTPNMTILPALEAEIERQGTQPSFDFNRWAQLVEARFKASNAKDRLIALGQDAVFAADWKEHAQSVGRAMMLFRDYLARQTMKVADYPSLSENSPLAQLHNTRYPLVQGPMTRVSDVAGFCEAVEQGGGLPFIALAMMSGAGSHETLKQTFQQMGGRPWGVGVLGFNDPELYKAQMAAVEEFRPPYAIISGGRPDQAARLEALGTLTYLHAPSPAILDIYLQEGARHFVFEGYECGGHVGPRASFVLWESMIKVLLESSLPKAEMEKISVLFAGGIHDAVSAAMVSALALPLAERGVMVGALMGTAYIFTREVVETGAIIDNFQQVALQTEYSVVAETGPGHAIRCAPTDFYHEFATEKNKLRQSGLDGEAVRQELDKRNIGRLRIASKGVQRVTNEQTRQSDLTVVDDAIQQQEGIYMLGQVAALNNQVFSIAELHAQVCNGAQDILNQSAKQASAAEEKLPEAPPPLDIAIVGISCLLPGGANDANSYWDNIIHARDSIDEVPADRFDYRYWFDEDRDAHDKIYSKWGGFIEDIPFDPIKYGIPPNSLTSIEPMQLIALELIDQALKDAGYVDSNPYKERTGVIFGVGGGASELGSNYIVRSALPRFFDSAEKELLSELPEWTEDSFAGILLNVVTGRATNRFDFGGVNFTVDAACASSLASLYLACRELAAGTADMMITGGCDTTQNPFGYLCFSKTGALSPSGRSRTFDANSDGIVTSEGHAAIILKRLDDAERDGDKIYAVLKGVAGGSDGRQKGLTAPREDGQLRTLQRAYAQARYSPATVGLFEAHGTGTVVGDRTESTALTSLLNESDAPHKSVAIGSVKSMIGHTKCSAGIAGLIKIALSLRHQVLPPTLHVKEPNTQGGLNNGPLYINSELRPWIKGVHPRRASVSAFGFGGTNFHATLEEYQATVSVKDQLALPRNLPAELFIFVADSGEALARRINLFAQSVKAVIANDVDIDLADLAYTWHQQTVRNHGSQRATLVAENLSDLPGQLDALESLVSIGDTSEQSGIFYTPEPLGSDTPIAFIFPGQGSQKPNMMRDLTVVFKEILDGYQLADQLLPDAYAGESLSAKIFPPPMFSDEERKNAFESLKITDVAQPALGVSSVAMLRMLKSFGLNPAMVAGHSYGELVALHAAGAIDEASLYRMSWLRGDAIMQMTRQSGDLDLGGMLAVAADETAVKPLLSGLEGCWLANLNSPRQTVISGNEAGLAAVAQRIEEAGLSQVALPVACAFHSPIMQPASETFAGVLDEHEFAAAELAVYSNVSAKAYAGDDFAQYRQTLTQQLIQPVRFEEEIKEMYQGGARVFVEVGPGMVLSKLTAQILGDRPHVAIATNTGTNNDVSAFLSALGELAAHGVQVNPERLYIGRELKTLDLFQLANQPPHNFPAHTWLLNGSYIRPLEQAPRHDNPRFQLASGEETSQEPIQESRQVNAVPPPAEIPAALPPGGVPGNMTGDVKTHAFMRFQETMRQFLENQQEIMQVYLGSHKDSGERVDSVPVVPTSPGMSEFTTKEQLEFATKEQITKQEIQTDVKSTPATPVPIPVSTPVAVVDLRQTLTDLIAERTGYPPEMLDIDANLEADLGVDSIKRVEIIAAFRRAVCPEMQEPTQNYIDRMAEVRSMQDILDVIGDFVAPADSAAAIGFDDQGEVSDPAIAGITQGVEKCPRCVVRAFSADLASIKNWSIPTGTILLTDDGLGLSQQLIDNISAGGGNCVLLSEQDLESPMNTLIAVDSARNRLGPIAALIHLVPLSTAPEFPGIDAHTWDQFVHREINSLLYLLKAMAPELDNRETEPVSILCGTHGGGDFDSASNPECQYPWRGGIAGLIKVAAKEWPANYFHAADFDQLPGVDKILIELGNHDFIEVGYRDDKRFALLPVHEELLADSEDLSRPLDSDDIVLVTGGARGITAEVAKFAAAQSKATLILLGRSPEPSEEDVETRSHSDPVELRRALISRAHDQGVKLSPRDIEAELKVLLANREIHATLEAIGLTGARAEYLSCDIRDPASLTEVVTDVQQRLGVITAVIHGAGIIEDRYIVDKTSESFDRVMQTKLNPVLTLIQVLDLEQLKLLMLFSSTAGFFGNPGQGDYASANEILNRMARRMQSLVQSKVAAMNWGPWTGAGMVKEEVKQQFYSRGVGMVTIEGGARVAWEEIKASNKSPVRVLLGPGSWNKLTPGSQHLIARTPLLQDQSVYRLADGSILARVVLDERSHGYLLDHRIDQKSVLPLTFVMELMAEVAALSAPDWVVTRLDNLRLFNGVVIGAGYREILVRAKSVQQSAESAEWQVSVFDPLKETPPFYQASVILALEAPHAPKLSDFEHIKGSFPKPVDEAYQNWLFHGPSFHAVSSIQGCDNSGIDASVQPTTSGMDKLINGGQGWIFNPLVLDCAPQLAILWSRAQHNSTSLPNAVSSYSCYGPMGNEPLDVYIRMDSTSGEQTYKAEAIFVRDGEILGKIERLEGAGSSDFNKVAQG
ncbi:MAG: SDR family NAD(P)-dependent oxidoreductase [Gammaproteobacteria bacterium]|nr:SDR family NAD(P)-dependent oxidoreductase [Gammaproteobacteria bacterium]